MPRRSRPELLAAANWQSQESRWDWLALSLLAALLLFMPLSFGAVEAWSELVVVLVSLGTLLLLALRQVFDPHFQLVRTSSYAALAAILALGFLQTVPLPSSFLGLVAPANLAVRQELLAPNGPASHHAASHLSLCPYATRHDLRMALAFTALFVSSASLFRSSTQIQRVLGLIFGIGCLEAAIAVLQIMTHSKKLLWMFDSHSGVVTSGTFVNYSHFSQFVNLSLGSGIALMLVRLKEDKRADQLHGGAVVRIRWDRYLRLLAGIVLCAVAILLSMSRNGAFSMLAAAGAIGVILYHRGELSTRGWLLGMAPWCVLIVLFLTSFDVVYNRLATLEDAAPFEGRYEMTTATLRAWREYPLWGTGLGTHEFVFPRFDEVVTPQLAEHADNDWAQLLEEFGTVGAATVLAFLVSIAAVALRLMLKGSTILSMASFGLSFGLIAAAIHSLSDFGQHLPAVFGLTAVTSGLLVSLARHEERERRRLPPRSGRYRFKLGTWSRGIVAAVTLVAWLWAGWGALHAYRGETWANAALTLESRVIQANQEHDPARSDQAYIDLLTAAEYAAAAEPDNVKHAYVLNLNRWRSLSRVVDPDTGAQLLHPDVLPFVAQIADALTHARVLCPTYGPLYALEGNLRYFVLNQPEGARLIERAAELAPYDSLSTQVAAQLAAEAGQVDEAHELLLRSVELDPLQFLPAAECCLTKLQRPDLAIELAGSDHRKQLRLADLLESLAGEHPEYRQLADQVRATAEGQLELQVKSGEAAAGDIARLAGQRLGAQDYEAAVDLYRQALAKDYGQVGWRLSLVRALAGAGDPAEGIREAKKCLRLRPGMPAATRLIEQLSLLPTETKESHESSNLSTPDAGKTPP